MDQGHVPNMAQLRRILMIVLHYCMLHIHIANLNSEV